VRPGQRVVVQPKRMYGVMIDGRVKSKWLTWRGAIPYSPFVSPNCDSMTLS
jgi:hypothetical protein